MKSKKPIKRNPIENNPVAKNAHKQNRAMCLEPHKAYKRKPKHPNRED